MLHGGRILAALLLVSLLRRFCGQRVKHGHPFKIDDSVITLSCIDTVAVIIDWNDYREDETP